MPTSKPQAPYAPLRRGLPMPSPETRQPCAYCSETERPGGVYRGATQGPSARRFCSYDHLCAWEAREEYEARRERYP
jgi:hypothetical protein